MSGLMLVPTVLRPIIGFLSSVAPRGNGMPWLRQYYLHHYLRGQPNLNWHHQEVVDAMFGEVRFWLDAGIDGLRLDAITTLTHDPELRNNPPVNPDPEITRSLPGASNPFNWQQLVYTRDQARTLELLGELRAIVNQYDDRYLIGEVADVEMISVSAKYTRSGEHLHSCYNFELMQRAFTALSLSEVIAKTEAVLLGGWTTWAMSNHDNLRVVTRAGQSPELQGDPRALAKLLLAALLSFRGGACVYQGEELGLTEADIAFEGLQDPFGINFGLITRAVTGAEPLCHGLPYNRMEDSAPLNHGCRYLPNIYYWP